MEKVFFITYRVAPNPENAQLQGVEGAFAFTWVLADDVHTALTKSEFFIERAGWLRPVVKSEPIEIQRHHCSQSDFCLKYFDQCMTIGHAEYFEGWGEKFTTPQELPLQIEPGIDMEQLWKDKKRISRRKRCLHFDAGENCDSIINAHSVQKNRSLSVIAENGHVYQVNPAAMRDPRKEKPVYTLEGINKATTFLGFCKRHDNEVFQPIDDFDLVPTARQAILYGYRSLCREMHHKLNAIEFKETLLKKNPDMNPASKRMTKDYLEGAHIGLESLKKTKILFEDVLKKSMWEDVKFTVFTVDGDPNMAFSGLIFPDHDFLGRTLQNIADPSTSNQTLAFCSAPMKDGWGILFCWHKEHDECCSAVMSSLATVAYEGDNSSDALFRFTISSCENLALKPSWYDSLPDEKKHEIENVVKAEADMMCAINAKRYTQGLDGIVDWKLKHVILNNSRQSDNKE